MLHKNLIKYIAVSVLAVSVLAAYMPQAANDDWGLSFPSPGAAPRGNASAKDLLAHDTYFIGDGSEKVIYMTFDAGYENGYTQSILDVLKKTKVPAAFFLVGTYIRDNAQLVRRMVDEGHIVANHTMTHPDMSAISSPDAFAQELSKTEQVYKVVTERDMPKYYRPPRGKYSTDNLRMAKELGYKTVFWSLAYVDWDVNKQPSKEAAFDKLIPRIHPGAVLLLHSTSSTNAQILEELINKYREMGYEFKSIEHLTGA